MVNYTPRISRDTCAREKQKDEHFTSNHGILTRLLRKTLPLREDMDIAQAGDFFINNQITGLPVVDSSERLVGFLSQKDCLKYSLESKYYNNSSPSVRYYMSENVITIPSKASLTFIVELFLHYPYQAFPVIEEDHVLGIIERGQVFEVVHNMQTTNW